LSTPSHPTTEQNPPDDHALAEPSQADALQPLDIAGVIRLLIDGLRDLKRIGLPSDELDRLKQEHPEAYEIYLSEQREQPAHDRKLELGQLALARQQLEQANTLQNAQLELASKSLDLQQRGLNIWDSNARTGRKLSWVFVTGLLLLSFSALAINAFFLWHGKVDDFGFSTSVIGGLLVAGGIVAVIRQLTSHRRSGLPSDSELADKDRSSEG